jgi:CBS domain-containing protein
MKVRDAMSRDAQIANPNMTLQEAARLMSRIDAGFLPVGDGDRLVGMVTDRDITIRAVAEGKAPTTPISEVMTRDVKYCFDDDDVSDVARNMADIQVRRLPVLNREKRLIGVVSVGDLSKCGADPAMSGKALSGIAKPGGEHTQASTRH